MAPALADVFLVPARSIVVHTTPGRRVSFFGGHARIVDNRDMPFMLAMPDAKVIPSEGACSWAEDWLRHTNEIKASVEWPEGWKVDHINKDEWTISKPEGDTEAVPPDDGLTSPGSEQPPSWPSGGKGLMDALFGPPPADPPVATPKPKARSRRRKAA